MNMQSVWQAFEALSDTDKRNFASKLSEFAHQEAAAVGIDIPAAKRLPRDEQGRVLPFFQAGGHRYHILSPETGIGIDRFTQYQKMSLVVGTGKTFQQIAKGYDECNALALADKPYPQARLDIVIHNTAMKEGVLALGEARYDMVFYMCSLFIVREGEDLTRWTQAEAELKIADWNNEGFAASDFFLLATNFIEGFAGTWQELSAKVKAKTDILGDTNTAS